MKSRITSYIEQLNQVFDGNLWLDESFSKKLDNLTDEQAFTPSPGNNHSVAEVVSHITQWRKELIRRLEHNTERRLTVESENNWMPITRLKESGWHHLYTDLKKTQQEINHLLEHKDDSFLDEKLGETGYNKEYFVAGLLHHDFYHLGQIGLIMKFMQ